MFAWQIKILNKPGCNKTRARPNTNKKLRYRWDGATAETTTRPILVPIERLYEFLLVNDINLPPILHRFQVMVDYFICQMFASDRGVPHFNALAGDDPMRISLKLNSLGYISVAESIGVSSTTFTQWPRKLPNSVE